MKHVSTITLAFLLVSFALLAEPQTVWSRDGGKQKDNQVRTSSTAPKSLNEELAALRTKVAQLEAALKAQHQSPTHSATGQGKANRTTQGGEITRSSQEKAAEKPAPANATPKNKGMKAADSMAGGMKGMSGMGRMKLGRKMGKVMMSAKGKQMGRMSGKGMGMMGRMPQMAGMAMPSALPGFPGASHIYHIGSTGFFLDHGEHITLSQEQRTKLNQFKEQSLLTQATFTRQAEEAEQELWTLTGSDKPDAAKIDAQVRKIAKLQGDQRIAFIRRVGDAATVLTAEQRQALLGEYVARDNQAASPKPNE